MLRSIKSNLESLNRPSSLLMLNGTMFCCILLIFAFVMYLLNDISSNYSYLVNETAKLIATTATFVFAEIIAGGLIMDIYAKKNNIE